MILYDPVGKDRLAFLQGQNLTQQYRLLLSFFGNQPFGRDTIVTTSVLLERIHGTQMFVDTLLSLYGEVISPLELTPQMFSYVVYAWHTSLLTEQEFALRAKVAAWLSDLVIDHETTPYLTN